MLGLQTPAPSSSHLVLGLAVAAAALLIIVAVAGLHAVPLLRAGWSHAIGRRAQASSMRSIQKSLLTIRM